MMNKTKLFGSILAAGCVLVSVQNGYGQDKPLAQNGTRTKTAANGRSTSKTTDKTSTEVAKYQLSIHRTDIIKADIDGYAASGEDLSGNSVLRMVLSDIGKQMTLVPAKPLEKADPQLLNEQAKKLVEQEYGTDDKKYSTIVEAEANAEFPMFKIGDKVTVRYNMGPKFYSVTGILYRVTENAITVDDKVINLIDLNDETRSKFDAQKNKYMRSRYIETHIHLLNRLKLEKIQDNYDKLKADIFKRNETAGYIYDPQLDHWATAQDVAKSYLERLAKDQQAKAAARPKPVTKPEDGLEPGTGPVALEPDDPGKTTPAAGDKPVVKPNNSGKTTDKGTGVVAVNDSIKLEDNEQSRKMYETVMAKADKQRKETNEIYAGIDADPGYKNALWGFSIAEVRYALWHDPEFAFIKPNIGRDSIVFPQDEEFESELPIPPVSVDLVYVSNGLSKVVYTMTDAPRKDFIRFKDSLMEKYGHAVEDKGPNSVAFNNIFSGKTKPRQIADPDVVESVKTAAKDAEKAFNAAEAALKVASDEDRADLQTKRDDAATALQNAIAKASEFEDAVSQDSLPYVYSRIKLGKDDKGRTILPFSFTWKGQNVTGTLVFYYNKTTDKVESIVFAKEYDKK